MGVQSIASITILHRGPSSKLKSCSGLRVTSWGPRAMVAVWAIMVETRPMVSADVLFLKSFQ